MVLGRLVRIFGLAHLVLGAIAATLMLSEPNIRRYGDNLQIALPLIAWTCALSNGAGGEYGLRFVLTMAIAHDVKAALGAAPLNRRPSGGYRGFPSAHTAAAAFGASSLASDCLGGNIAAQTVVVLSAALVGTSRIVVGAHSLLQVLAGALLGWSFDRILRRGPGRAVVTDRLGRLRARLRLEGGAGPFTARRALGTGLAAILLAVFLIRSAG